MLAAKQFFTGLLVITTLLAGVVAHAETRSWTDSTQKFKREASFQALDGALVILMTTDGKELRIPLEKLSTVDQAFAKQAASIAEAADPFQVVEPPSIPRHQHADESRVSTRDVPQFAFPRRIELSAAEAASISFKCQVLCEGRGAHQYDGVMLWRLL